VWRVCKFVELRFKSSPQAVKEFLGGSTVAAASSSYMQYPSMSSMTNETQSA
jgi:hypothetical protein